jgi:hypothetical protein
MGKLHPIELRKRVQAAIDSTAEPSFPRWSAMKNVDPTDGRGQVGGLKCDLRFRFCADRDSLETGFKHEGLDGQGTRRYRQKDLLRPALEGKRSGGPV